MPKLKIDGREVTVPEGATVLDAARELGIYVPSLCHYEGLEPSTSCMTCLVRVGDSLSLQPSCATVAVDGMEIESESDAVHAARRSSLELLLSDHAGDCVAPCQVADNRHADFPQFVRQVAAGDLDGAAKTLAVGGLDLDDLDNLDVRRAMKACRRGRHDEAVAIERLVRCVAAARDGTVADEDEGEDGSADEKAAGAGDGAPAYRAFSVRLGKMSPEEMAELLAGVSDTEQVQPEDSTRGYTAEEACAEASRCLRCDCRQAHSCQLRDACEAYGVQTSKFRVPRPPLYQDRAHPDITHEPGKCIRCGLCLQVVEREGEEIGLAFAGRGFDMCIKVPFGGPLAKALEKAGLACARVCPTGALAPKKSE
ncbi:MAG: 2Fe-2S iron-sulfur cluster-binding protein [Planctomycetota bacterium]